MSQPAPGSPAREQEFFQPGSGLIQIHASAGSGKTFALTSSYLDALSRIRVTDPRAMAAAASGILAITFTNAAANEMRERVIGRLKEIALGLAAPGGATLAPERAEDWLRVFLRDASVLNIRTIDSLLHQIIRASALDLRVHPDYETVMNPSSVMHPLLEECLEMAENDGPQRAMLRKACRLMVESRSVGFGNGAMVAEGIEELIEAALLGHYDNMTDPAMYPEIGRRIATEARRAAARLLDLADEAGLAWAPRKKPALRKYADGDFCARPSKIITDADAALLFRDERVPEEIAAAYGIFCQRTRMHYAFEAAAGFAVGFVPLLDFARGVAREYMDRQRESGWLLQSLVSRYAREALAPGAGVSDALCRLGSRLFYAFIDEFQDTSRDQWAAVKPLALDALARGGAMTWVGDVKQSIYGWRGGDATLFDAPCRDAELLAVAREPEVRALDTNRRSRREIVEHNNMFFAPLASASNVVPVLAAMLPKDAPEAVICSEAAIIAANYRDVEQKPWTEKGDGGYVRLELLEAGDAAQSRLEGAARVLEILQTEIRPRRPWSDVLVLVRGSADAHEVVEALSGAGIPVVTENGLLLSGNSLIGEIVSFLRFLNNPDDDISLWVAISGEILGAHPEAAGIGAADPATWLGFPADARLYQRLRQLYPEVWQSLVAPFYSNAGLLTAYDTIHEIYLRFGVEKRFARDATMLRRFLELAYQLENSGVSSLGGFLDYWDEHGAEEKAPMPEQMDAVRIMTIHKAKGLQAPVVMLPTTMFPVRPSKLPILVNVDGCVMPVKSMQAVGDPHYRHLAFQASEALNLLYVAMTRAEEELYVLHPAAYKSSGTQTLNMALNRLLEMTGRQGGYEYGRRPGVPAPAWQPDGDAGAGVQSPDIAMFPPDWRPMAWLPRIRIFRNQLDSGDLTANERGTLAHAALERLSLDYAPREAAEIALESAARALGMAVPDAERENLLEALAWYAALPQARLWRDAGFAEHSFLLAGGRLLRPDLIVPQPCGPLVIDYKTGQPREDHIGQMRDYLACILESGQFAGMPRACLVYLDLRRFRSVTLQEVDDLSRFPPETSVDAG